MTAIAPARAGNESTTAGNVTVDESGTLVLPSAILRVLRPEGERLTLLDIVVENGIMTLRRSHIAAEDWWAYTPEHKAAVERALQSPVENDLRLSQADLERMAEIEPE